MARDSQHQKAGFSPSEIEHLYGANVHIISSPLALSLLAKLGSPETHQPFINQYVSMLYDQLFDFAADAFFPKSMTAQDTRMKAFHAEAVYEGVILNPETEIVTVDLARAGTLPSQACYNKLNYLMNPSKVRQDHFYIARATNEKNEVTGVTVSGSKIGGPVKDAIVLLPDPMGATGGTIVEVYNHYQKGNPKMMIAMHLMVTPEYLKRVTKACPDLKVIALRLDRGLSTEKVLSSVPGKFWDEERGLNNHQYIVPGAGGLGEILNNAFC